MDGKNCLVTGAAGFIGSHLCRRLLDEGAQVHALVRPGTSLERIAGFADRLVIHRADLADRNALSSCLAQAEPHIVYHLATPTRFAGNNPVANAAASIETIVQPLIALVEALAELPRPPDNFVRTGTIAEYGNVAFPYREEQREAPVTPYGTAMLAGTHYLALLQDDLPFPSVTARLALTYGEGQSPNFFVPALFEACQTGRPIKLRHPDDRRDLIHVDDVIDALLVMGQAPLPGARHINVSTGQAPTMRQVASRILEVMGRNPDLVDVEKHSASHKPSVLLSDAALAGQIYGWRSKIGIDRGLEMLANAYLHEHNSLRQHHA